MNFIKLDRVRVFGSVEYSFISVIYGFGFVSPLALLELELEGIDGCEVGSVGLGGPTCFLGKVVPAIEVDGPAIGGPAVGLRAAAPPLFFLGMNNAASAMVSMYVW